MRLLANENFILDAVEALRANGHDIVWIREESRGAPDEKIELSLHLTRISANWPFASNFPLKAA